MNLVELLKIYGFDTSDKKIKLVRHQDQRYDVKKLATYNQLNTYQCYQAKHIFNCEYIISFIGEEKSKAIFYGVFKINGGPYPASDYEVPKDFIFPEMSDDLEDCFYYDLEEVSGFDDLKNRVVIDWGKSPISWHQWKLEKEVVEIRPKGFVKEFQGFHDFILEFKELEDIINNPNANDKWKNSLSSVAGIYLIVDTNNGNQYVGSASGKEGIWGRWENYVKTGHGGNIELKKLLDTDTDYKYKFQFTILRTLPKSLTNKEVVSFENLYKKKLGTRSFGLNIN